MHSVKGVSDIVGSYEDEIGDQLGSIIDEEDGVSCEGIFG